MAGKKFPDLTGDGKVTQKDILKGRGVTGFEEGGKAISDADVSKLVNLNKRRLRQETGNSISNADKAALRKLVQETGNKTKSKTDRQVMQFEHGGEVRGMGKAYTGSPRKVKIT